MKDARVDDTPAGHVPPVPNGLMIAAVALVKARVTAVAKMMVGFIAELLPDANRIGAVGWPGIKCPCRAARTDRAGDRDELFMPCCAPRTEDSCR